MTNITKETKKSAINYVKDYIQDGKVRKDLIKKIKELDYDQPEQKLANLFLENDLTIIFTRLFFTEGDRYLIGWLASEYDASYSVETIEKMIGQYGIMAVSQVEKQLFESMLDLVTVEKRLFFKQMNAFHQKLIQEYVNEMEKIYKEEKQRLEKDKAKNKW